MKCQMQPVGTFFKFAAVTLRNPVEGEFFRIMIVAVKTFENEFAAVFLMQFFKSSDIKVVKERGDVFLYQIGEKEAVVVDTHGITFE